MFRLALIQMRVDGGTKSRNIARAGSMIDEAADRGADLALLPEAMDLGWTHPSALTEDEPIPDGAPFLALAKAARTNSIHVCAGLTEKAEDEVYNSAVLIGPDGGLLLLHRKLNELEIGHPYYARGDRLGVCSTALGTIGIMICADAFARDRVISRSLGYMGADIILSPCSWAVPADHDNEREPYGQLWIDSYVPVAKEFTVWIAGASNVGELTGGPWAGRKCIGSSLVIDPRGDIAAHGPYGTGAEEILYVDGALTPRPVRGCGRERGGDE